MKNQTIFTKMFAQDRSFEALAKKRNPNTAADEVAIGFQIALTVCAIMTALFTTKNWLTKFEGMAPPVVVLAIAATLALLLEFIKIWTGRKFIRSITQGWMQSWSSLAFWGFVGVVAFGGFKMSVENSTAGIESTILSAEFSKPPAPDYTQVTVIDNQIAQAADSRTKAMGLKIEGNVTSWAGQMQGSRISESITALQAQRKSALESANAAHAEATRRWEELARSKGSETRKLGGWLEIITGILMIALELALLMLVRQNKQDSQPTPTQNTTPPHRNGNNNHSQQINQQPFHNSDRPVIQAFTSHKQQPAPTCDTVSQLLQPVVDKFSAPAGIDQSFDYIFQKVRRDVANLNNANGVVTTVCNRITNNLEVLAKLEFSEVGENLQTKWTNYLTGQAVPIFKTVGYTPDLSAWVDNPYDK